MKVGKLSEKEKQKIDYALINIEVGTEKFILSTKELRASADKTAGSFMRLSQVFKAYKHKFFPNELIK